MSIYNPKSLKAEEFINHEEILETIEYAEKNKRNVELIDSILNKARIYVSCDNVYMWDHYDAGFSPEAATQDNASSDWAAYPLSRTFSLGVNITF